MIVSCPSCTLRFRLDAARHQGKRVTLKCIRCGKIFKAEVPIPSAAVPASLQVMIAHSDQALCAVIADILAKENIGCLSSHDGHHALQSMLAMAPHVAIIDVALPGLFAFEVVEKVRKRPGLNDVKIILLSSVYNKTAYKRTPSSLYGADDYIEKHHLSCDLVPKIRRLATGDQPPVIGGKKEEDGGYSERLNTSIQEAEREEVSLAREGEAVEKARRLARIIVSDIALYNQERVDEGIRTGRFFDMFSREIGEGKRLFAERIAPELCRQEDFLQAAFDSFIERRQRELRP
jgi:predicted Zn finger-like uncharacterized protein